MTKNVGKPYEGKLHVRFDEGGLKVKQRPTMESLFEISSLLYYARLLEGEGLLGRHRFGFCRDGLYSGCFRSGFFRNRFLGSFFNRCLFRRIDRIRDNCG